MKKVVFASLLSLFFLTACSTDDATDLSENPGAYEDGFFVTNEGTFGSTEGSVSFIADDLTTVEQAIYFGANPDSDLGLGFVLQSMFFYGENAYIISNGSNLITVVNRNTFEFVGEIDGGLNAPRYGAVANGKAFVTNQASWQTSDDDFIAVIDLETLEVEKTIQTHAPVEYILEENGKIFVQNASFSMGSQISIIDPSSATISESILVGEGLNGIEIEGGTLYALVGSGIKTMDLTSFEVSNLVDFPANIGQSNLEVEDGKIYYTSGNSVFSMEITATETPTVPIIETDEIAVLYGFAVEDDKIYLADAEDFTSNSSVFVFGTSGDLLKEIPVGVAPNGFYFNEQD